MELHPRSVQILQPVAPLGAGTYMLWLYDGDAGANYSFNAVAAAVPEPATWMLMLAGLGLVGATLRIRSRQFGAATA